MVEVKSLTVLTEAEEESFPSPPPGLKIISRALEIPLVGDAVDQTLSVHNSMLERGGLISKAYSLWFSTACTGLNVAASALKATETTSGATQKVWAKWVSIDDVLAEKLGIQPGSKNHPREILIEVGGKPADLEDDPENTKTKFGEEESGKEDCKLLLPDVCKFVAEVVPLNLDKDEKTEDKLKTDQHSQGYCMMVHGTEESRRSRINGCSPDQSTDEKFEPFEASTPMGDLRRRSSKSKFRIKNQVFKSSSSTKSYQASLDSSSSSDEMDVFNPIHLTASAGSRTGNEQIGDKAILKTYLALNRIDVIEEDNLEKEFGLLGDILGLYSHLGSD